MHTAAARIHRVGFSKASVSVGALLHGAALVGAHVVAKRWESPVAKIATYAAAPVFAGFTCKLLHERQTRREKEVLGLAEDVERLAL